MFGQTCQTVTFVTGGLECYLMAKFKKKNIVQNNFCCKGCVLNKLSVILLISVPMRKP